MNISRLYIKANNKKTHVQYIINKSSFSTTSMLFMEKDKDQDKDISTEEPSSGEENSAPKLDKGKGKAVESNTGEEAGLWNAIYWSAKEAGCSNDEAYKRASAAIGGHEVPDSLPSSRSGSPSFEFSSDAEADELFLQYKNFGKDMSPEARAAVNSALGEALPKDCELSKAERVSITRAVCRQLVEDGSVTGSQLKTLKPEPPKDDLREGLLQSLAGSGLSTVEIEQMISKELARDKLGNYVSDRKSYINQLLAQFESSVDNPQETLIENPQETSVKKSQSKDDPGEGSSKSKTNPSKDSDDPDDKSGPSNSGPSFNSGSGSGTAEGNSSSNPEGGSNFFSRISEFFSSLPWDDINITILDILAKTISGDDELDNDDDDQNFIL